MLSRIPFLIGSAAGEAVAPITALLTVPASVAAKAAPADVFRNCRRVSLCITLLFLQTLKRRPAVVGVRFSASQHGLQSGSRKTSSQLLQVNPRLQHLVRLHHLFPRNLMPLVSRRACQYARNRRLRSLIRLIVKISAGNALHKRFFLLAVGKF